jgi:hypothetical protein
LDLPNEYRTLNQEEKEDKQQQQQQQNKQKLRAYGDGKEKCGTRVIEKSFVNNTARSNHLSQFTSTDYVLDNKLTTTKTITNISINKVFNGIPFSFFLYVFVFFAM